MSLVQWCAVFLAFAMLAIMLVTGDVTALALGFIAVAGVTFLGARSRTKEVRPRSEPHPGGQTRALLAIAVTLAAGAALAYFVR